jgi:hypothetical protein
MKRVAEALRYKIFVGYDIDKSSGLQFAGEGDYRFSRKTT